MAPELRKLALSLPPEVPPGKATGIEAIRLGLDVVQDVLRKFELARVERLRASRNRSA